MPHDQQQELGKDAAYMYFFFTSFRKKSLPKLDNPERCIDWIGQGGMPRSDAVLHAPDEFHPCNYSDHILLIP